MDHEDITCVRFRDLRRFNPQGIDKALDIPEKIVKLAIQNVVKAQKAKTFRRGIIDSWKEEMPEDIRKEYIDQIGDLIIRLGFEV